MHQHAVRTAVTLYSEGTWTLQTAATHAGVAPAEIERTVERYGIEVDEPAIDSPERVRVAAD